MTAGNGDFGNGASVTAAKAPVGFSARIARGLIRARFPHLAALAAALLDRLPHVDHDGIQVFTPNPDELRSVAAVGDPDTHSIVRAATLDHSLASGEWDSGPGQHVIKFDFDEWAHILEGETHVTVQGRTHVLRAGDAALFRAGLSMTWNVPRYVRKVWVHRYPTPSLIERTAIKLVKLFSAQTLLIQLIAWADGLMDWGPDGDGGRVLAAERGRVGCVRQRLIDRAPKSPSDRGRNTGWAYLPQMQHPFERFANAVALTLECISVLLIACGALRALVGVVQVSKAQLQSPEVSRRGRGVFLELGATCYSGSSSRWPRTWCERRFAPSWSDIGQARIDRGDPDVPELLPRARRGTGARHDRPVPATRSA